MGRTRVGATFRRYGPAVGGGTVARVADYRGAVELPRRDGDRAGQSHWLDVGSRVAIFAEQPTPLLQARKRM